MTIVQREILFDCIKYFWHKRWREGRPPTATGRANPAGIRPESIDTAPETVNSAEIDPGGASHARVCGLRCSLGRRRLSGGRFDKAREVAAEVRWRRLCGDGRRQRRQGRWDASGNLRLSSCFSRASPVIQSTSTLLKFTKWREVSIASLL
jgi:hypothetical protein